MPSQDSIDIVQISHKKKTNIILRRKYDKKSKKKWNNRKIP